MNSVIPGGLLRTWNEVTALISSVNQLERSTQPSWRLSLLWELISSCGGFSQSKELHFPQGQAFDSCSSAKRNKNKTKQKIDSRAWIFCVFQPPAPFPSRLGLISRAIYKRFLFEPLLILRNLFWSKLPDDHGAFPLPHAGWNMPPEKRRKQNQEGKSFNLAAANF